MILYSLLFVTFRLRWNIDVRQASTVSENNFYQKTALITSNGWGTKWGRGRTADAQSLPLGIYIGAQIRMLLHINDRVAIQVIRQMRSTTEGIEMPATKKQTCDHITFESESMNRKVHQSSGLELLSYLKVGLSSENQAKLSGQSILRRSSCRLTDVWLRLFGLRSKYLD